MHSLIVMAVRLALRFTLIMNKSDCQWVGKNWKMIYLSVGLSIKTFRMTCVRDDGSERGGEMEGCASGSGMGGRGMMKIGR